jgi:hypothetical protein
MSSIVEDIVIIDDGLTPVQRYFKKLTDLVDLIVSIRRTPYCQPSA